jgi:colanic acid/amylovoran biosynthesis protein
MATSQHTGIKRILLIGAGFRNKGAEAMALTAVQNFTRLYPGAQITVASYSKKESRPYGAQEVESLDPGQAPILFDLIKNTKKISHSFRILLHRILLSTKIRSALIGKDRYLQAFTQSDLVVDLSGFAMSDDRTLVRRLVYCFEIFTARCLKKPFVIFTQSMGPLRKLFSRLAARFFLPSADLLIARGQSSREHLLKSGFGSKEAIPVCSDSAFLFKPSPQEEEQAKTLLESVCSNAKPLFGIVPNINIYRRSDPKDDSNPYIQFLAGLCDFAQGQLGAQVAIVCHEKYEYQEDDEWLARKVLSNASDPESILVVGAEHSAGVLKAVIGTMDFVAASRYHSLVAAISTGTPFFAIGWAHKYAELAADAGIEGAATGFKEKSPQELNGAIQRAWSLRENTAKQLEDAKPRLRASAEKAYQLVAEKWPGATHD